MNQRDRTEVVAALIWRNDRILIAKRKEEGRFGGKWEFPGGKLEPNETPEIALRREIEEELRVSVEVGEKIFMTDYDYPEFKVRLHFYRCAIPADAICFMKDHSELRWVKPKHLRTFDFLEADRPILEELSRL